MKLMFWARVRRRAPSRGRRQVPTRYSIRHGKVIAETKLAETTIHLNDNERVTYR